MHLCTQTMPFDDPLEDVFAFCRDVGIEGVDLHVDAGDYVTDGAARRALRELVADYGLSIDVLSALGPGVNPLHPDEERAAAADAHLRETIRLADRLAVDTVTAFAGLPAGSPTDTTPNWITATAAYPELADAYSSQWQETVEYWRDVASFAGDFGVDVAIEIHVNTMVNTPPALRKLREAAGDSLVGFLDTAHLILQHIDPCRSIRYLSEADALGHFEVADVSWSDADRDLHGAWDMSHQDAWTFCTIGEGHGDAYWAEVLSTLDDVGYDGAVSIQQLKTPMELREGLTEATDRLRPALE